MSDERNVYTSFSATDEEALRAPMKVGLLATINDEGLPHVTLIASLQAGTPTQVIWGQFCEGLCKQYVRRHPQTGFLIMTLQRELWRGKARFTHVARQGPEFDMYNNLPMFRYNAYFGVHTVYYMDLVRHYGKEALPMGSIVVSALKTTLVRACTRKRNARPVLNLWTRGLLNGMPNLKFVAYVREDGYPEIIPAIQAQARDRESVILAASPYGDELARIPAGATVAVFGMTLQMEDVLLRGTYRGVRRLGGVRCGLVDVSWVYNSMPPKPQQIYPEPELEAVTEF